MNIVFALKGSKLLILIIQILLKVPYLVYNSNTSDFFNLKIINILISSGKCLEESCLEERQRQDEAKL